MRFYYATRHVLLRRKSFFSGVYWANNKKSDFVCVFINHLFTDSFPGFANVVDVPLLSRDCVEADTRSKLFISISTVRDIDL